MRSLLLLLLLVVVFAACACSAQDLPAKSPIAYPASYTLTSLKAGTGGLTAAELPYCAGFTGEHPLAKQLPCRFVDEGFVNGAGGNMGGADLVIATRFLRVNQSYACGALPPNGTCDTPFLPPYSTQQAYFTTAPEEWTVAVSHGLFLRTEASQPVDSATMAGQLLSLNGTLISEFPAGEMEIVAVNQLLEAAGVDLDATKNSLGETLRYAGGTLLVQVQFSAPSASVVEYTMTAALLNFGFRSRVGVPVTGQFDSQERIFTDTHGLRIIFSRLDTQEGERTLIDAVVDMSLNTTDVLKRTRSTLEEAEIAINELFSNLDSLNRKVHKTTFADVMAVLLFITAIVQSGLIFVLWRRTSKEGVGAGEARPLVGNK